MDRYGPKLQVGGSYGLSFNVCCRVKGLNDQQCQLCIYFYIGQCPTTLAVSPFSLYFLTSISHFSLSLSLFVFSSHLFLASLVNRASSLFYLSLSPSGYLLPLPPLPLSFSLCLACCWAEATDTDLPVTPHSCLLYLSLAEVIIVKVCFEHRW